ncbi:MAG: hypothetical protein EOP85_03490 [Verrucomicrobiaceae bacterium]|nr:MAG: hypothetical protein EOP85_03490 [Verrucomicrobiaceae bacterium]
METIRIKEHYSDFTFTVGEGHVAAEGIAYLSGKQSFAFRLDQVNATPVITERRYPIFRTGMWTALLSLCGIIFLTMVGLGESTTAQDVRVVAVCFLISMVMIGVVIMGIFLRPARFVTVVNHAGQGLFHMTRTSANAQDVDRLLGLLATHAKRGGTGAEAAGR